MLIVDREGNTILIPSFSNLVIPATGINVRWMAGVKYTIERPAERVVKIVWDKDIIPNLYLVNSKPHWVIKGHSLILTKDNISCGRLFGFGEKVINVDKTALELGALLEHNDKIISFENWYHIIATGETVPSISPFSSPSDMQRGDDPVYKANAWHNYWQGRFKVAAEEQSRAYRNLKRAQIKYPFVHVLGASATKRRGVCHARITGEDWLILDRPRLHTQRKVWDVGVRFQGSRWANKLFYLFDNNSEVPF